MNVEVDEFLLDEARKVLPDEKPADVVAEALREVVRIARLKRGIQAMRETSDLFWPGYLEEIRPNSWAAYEQRRAAYEGRQPSEDRIGRRSD
ncbi:MAG TPA: hypothetical protein VKB93_23750 [Thermoanaerobaculia bacterium]|nr:hypothetical protein [Thermoanaerobaculia bacterium]